MISVPLQTVCRVALTMGTAATFLPLCGYAQAVAPAAPYFNRNVLVLDPAHGGMDNGATIGSQHEKDITLALATSLRAALVARGFTVVSTREADLPDAAAPGLSPPLLTTDQRAGIANHLRPAACLILHATTGGAGIHLFTSPLAPPDTPYEPYAILPWETAQALYIPQSLRLANDLGVALVQAKLPVLLTHASLRPLDNLTCPAIAIEIAPLASQLTSKEDKPKGEKTLSVTDAGYQRRVVEALAAAILAWRDRTAPRPAPPTPAAAAPKPPQPGIGPTP